MKAKCRNCGKDTLELNTPEVLENDGVLNCLSFFCSFCKGCHSVEVDLGSELVSRTLKAEVSVWKSMAEVAIPRALR